MLRNVLEVLSFSGQHGVGVLVSRRVAQLLGALVQRGMAMLLVLMSLRLVEGLLLDYCRVLAGDVGPATSRSKLRL